jgi:hypothetical protein
MEPRAAGTIHELQSGNWICDVEFALWPLGLGEAAGRIWIANDPHPALRFVADGTEDGAEKIFLLVTASGPNVGAKAKICFTSTSGAFKVMNTGRRTGK